MWLSGQPYILQCEILCCFLFVCLFFIATVIAKHDLAVVIMSVCQSVRLSVCPFVRCVVCDDMNASAVNIILKYIRSVQLVF